MSNNCPNTWGLTQGGDSSLARTDTLRSLDVKDATVCRQLRYPPHQADGQLLVGNGDRLIGAPLGASDGQVLTWNSAAPQNMLWASAGGAGGEANTLSAAGSGGTAPVQVPSKVGDDLRVRGFTSADSSVVLALPNATDLDFSVDRVTGGTALAPADEAVFGARVGDNLTFRGVTAGNSISLAASTASAVVIDSTAVDSASSLGAGESLLGAPAIAGTDLRLKSLVAGTDIGLTAAADTITIAYTGGAPPASALSAVLAVGNTTGASNIAIDAGQQLLGSGGFAWTTAPHTPGPDGIAIGNGATAGVGANAIAIGTGAFGNAFETITMGLNAQSNGAFGITIGSGATGTSSGVVIGPQAQGVGFGAVVIGDSAYAGPASPNSVVIGANASNNDDNCVVIGHNASNTGSRCVLVGYNSHTGSGDVCTIIGPESGNATLTGDGNASLGRSNLTALTSGFDNVAVGIGAGNLITTGQRNICIGYVANSAATSSTCIVIGSNASVSLGSDCIVIGRLATGTASDAIAVGESASAGSVSVAVGRGATASSAGVAYGTGAVATADGVALGRDAKTGSSSSAIVIGAYAGAVSITGIENILIGVVSGKSITSGASNIGIGRDALGVVATGSNNICIGNGAVLLTAVVASSTVVGHGANSNVSGAIALGRNAAATVPDGLFFPGSAAGTSLATVSGTAVEYDTASGQMGPIVSTRRAKTNIQDYEPAPDNAWTELQAVTYEELARPGERRLGLIAEDVAVKFPELVIYGHWQGESELSPTAVRYDKLALVLLEEMKAMRTELDEMHAALIAAEINVAPLL